MLSRALSYFRPELPRIIASFAMVSLGTFLGLLAPLTLALLIDLFTTSPKTAEGGGTWLHTLWDYVRPESIPAQILALTLITLVVRLLKELLQMYQTLLNIRIGYHGLMNVRCDLFRKLQELSIGYHRSQPQGDAIYRLSWDTFGFQTLYNVIFGSVSHVLTLGLMLALMFSFNWQLTLASLLVVPPLLWVIKSYGRLMQNYSTAAKEADSKLTTSIQRSVSAISLVQAFNRQADEQLRFTSTVQNSIAAWMKLHKQEVLYWLLLGTIFTVSTVGLFGLGGYLVHRGHLTIGLLTAFLGYLQGFYDPLNKLSASGSAYQGGLAGVKRVLETLDLPTAIHDTPASQPLPVQPRTLELRNVSFSYALAQEKLKPRPPEGENPKSEIRNKSQEQTEKSQTTGSSPSTPNSQLSTSSPTPNSQLSTASPTPNSQLSTPSSPLSTPNSQLPTTPNVLNSVSATIRPGQMVAFVGSSGVGKTTLLSLLPRFYDPTEGAITLDGIDLRNIRLADLRKHIALVLQENLVLPTTIAENIAYGLPPPATATPAQIRRAAELAGALDFIEKLPQGFNTEVAEGGGNLSGGQRQRIGIARALLTHSPILILDEPTSALDPHTEQLITQTLNHLRTAAGGGKTLILVSHRLSTVLAADQIFVMHEGRIIEQGTHPELIAQKGAYYQMAKHQLQLT